MERERERGHRKQGLGDEVKSLDCIPSAKEKSQEDVSWEKVLIKLVTSGGNKSFLSLGNPEARA